jgi:DNA-binding transcriptional LysR family regulator
MDRLAGIPAFESVVAAGSFAGAARALGLSVAAVSKQVRALEDRLGVRLLYRTTRQVRLTDAGQRFHERPSASSPTSRRPSARSPPGKRHRAAACGSAPP